MSEESENVQDKASAQSIQDMVDGLDTTNQGDE